jgi:hypothetical protein
MSFLCFPKEFYEGRPPGAARFFRPRLRPDLLFFLEQAPQITPKQTRIYMLLWKSNTKGKHLFKTIRSTTFSRNGRI